MHGGRFERREHLDARRQLKLPSRARRHSGDERNAAYIYRDTRDRASGRELDDVPSELIAN